MVTTRQRSVTDRIETAASVPARRPRLVAAVGLSMVVLLPVLVTVVTRVGSDYLPVQDLAVIDLRVRDVWTADVPLAGAYSRFGWSHPGPLLFWALAPLSALTGHAAWATLVGAALLQAAAVAWGCRLAWRRGGLPLVLGWSTFVALAYGATGSSMFLEAWNPHVAYPFFMLLLLYGWVIVGGAHRHLLGITVVASFLIQAHVGYIPLVGVVGGAALLTVVRAAQADQRPVLPLLRPPLIAAAVLWSPVVVDAVLHPPGNLFRIVEYFVGGGSGESALGLSNAVGLLAAEYRVLPEWLGGPELVEPLFPVAAPAAAAWLVVPAALLVVGWVLARRGGDAGSQRLLVMVALLNVCGLVALAQVVGEPEPYLFYWRVPLAVFSVLAAVWVIGTHLPVRAPRSATHVLVAAATVAVLVPSVGLAAQVVDHPDAVQVLEPVAADIIDQLDDHPPPEGTLLVRMAGSAVGGLQGGIFNELARRDVDVRFTEGIPHQFGRRRTIARTEADTTWLVVEEGRFLSFLEETPGATVLARTSALPAEEEAELAARQRELAEVLVDGGRADLVSSLDSPYLEFVLDGVDVGEVPLARIAQLNARAAERGVCRCAVVEFPLGARPVDSLASQDF